jgi:hypothetical protein
MLPKIQIRSLYNNFNSPILELDCGSKCAPHNPNGVPFCCDICEAVPAAYQQEWDYLEPRTDLWHSWRGDECAEKPEDPAQLIAETPSTMQLLACKGAPHCQREYRALSCRQFPFFPYITDDYAFIGFTYDWEFEDKCWVISHLNQVSATYRQEFITTFDELFNLWPQEMENYAQRSADMRTYFLVKHRRIPILFREGGNFFLNPENETLETIAVTEFPKFGVFQKEENPRI